MSYINLLILKLNNLSLLEHSVLQLCKQARIEDVSSTLKENGKIIISLQKKGLISTIKGKKGEDECKLWRATKIGTELLDYISTPDILDGDIQMFHYLCDMYLQEDKNRKAPACLPVDRNFHPKPCGRQEPALSSHTDDCWNNRTPFPTRQ